MSGNLHLVNLEHTNINMKARHRTPNSAIRAVREAIGLSQEEFGKPAGMSQSLIARLEAGAIRTTWDHAQKLGEAHGRDPRDLFPSSSRFRPEDDDQLAARAAMVARRLAGDDDSLMALIAGLAYAFLDLQRRGRVVSDDEETLARIESVLQRFRAENSGNTVPEKSPAGTNRRGRI